MPQVILHHQGAYQLFSLITDSPCFDKALTLEQLTEEIRRQSGQDGVDLLPCRLNRAQEKGSSVVGYTLEDVLQGNKAGPESTELPLNEFIERYLTL